LTLKQNTIWNLLGSGVPLIAGVALIPFILKNLGDEVFGVLTLIWGLIGYFSLFDFGTGRALTLEISKLNTSKFYDVIPHILRAGLSITFFTGLIGGSIVFLATPFMIEGWLKIDINFQADAKLAFQIASLGIVFTTLTSGLRGAQEGLGAFAASNLIKIFLGLCMFVLPAFSVWLHGPQLSFIAIYLTLARVLVLLLSIFHLHKYLFDFWNHHISLKHIKNLFSFGGWVTVSGVVGPLMVYGDRFFVSASVGAALLIFYALPQETLQRLLIIPTAITNALFPHLVSLNKDQLQTEYKKNYKQMTLIMGAICGILMIVIYPIFSLWITHDFAQKALPIALILIIGIWINSIAFIPYTFLHSVGKSKITAYFHVLELVLYCALLYALVNLFGLIGAALAWTLRVLLDLLLLHFAMKKYF
jgi:O-antigen/teichoic acid export membrane protein